METECSIVQGPAVPTRLNVVIVEDRLTDAELMAAELRRSGFEVQWKRVDTPSSFVAALQTPPDVVLADYSLPEFDAIQALGVLWEQRPGVPLIVVTGQLGDEAAAECMKLGACDYVLKDRLARLGPAVEIALQQRRIEEERSRAVAALEDSEERLKLVLEGSRNAFWDRNLITGQVKRSTQLAEMLGFDETAMERLNAEWSDLVHPSDAAASAAAFEAHLEGRTDHYEAEYRLRRADGTWLWVLDQGRVVQRDEAGRAVRAAGTYRDISESKAVRERLTQSLDELRALAQRLQTVREEERTGISREVHDVLGQEMTGFKMDVKWLADRLAALDVQEDVAPLLEKLNSMSRQLEQTMQTIRRISTELRPAVLDALGVVAALEWQASDFSRRAGIPCDFVSSHEDIDLDEERATAVFRIFQEALTNVARHAKATRVEAELTLSESGLRLVVRDNGVGISRERAGGTHTLGLLGMQERAMMFGGSIGFDGLPGQGTAVTLTMPLGA